MSYVPNVGLREAFEQSNIPAYRLAEDLGYWRLARGKRRGDDQAVRRALGLKSSRGHYRCCPPQAKMTEATAIRYAKVLGLDPVDLGF